MSPLVGWHSKRAGSAGPFAFQLGRRSRPLLSRKDPGNGETPLKGRLARGGWGGGSRFLSALAETFPSPFRVISAGKAKARLGRAFDPALGDARYGVRSP